MITSEDYWNYFYSGLYFGSAIFAICFLWVLRGILRGTFLSFLLIGLSVMPAMLIIYDWHYHSWLLIKWRLYRNWSVKYHESFKDDENYLGYYQYIDGNAFLCPITCYFENRQIIDDDYDYLLSRTSFHEFLHYFFVMEERQSLRFYLRREERSISNIVEQIYPRRYK